MRIHSYAAADAAGVARLVAACAERDEAVEPVSEREWVAFAARSFNRGARDFAVAREGAEVVGVLTSTRLDTTDPPLRHFRILVHPDSRRRGIGSALFRLVEAQDEPGSVTLQSNVPDAWTFGRMFLETRGFRAARRHLEMARRGRAPAPAPVPRGTTLRPFGGGARDVAAWRGLNQAGYAGDPDRQDLTVEDVALLASAPGFGLWLAESDGEPAGLCHVSGEATGTARVESLVVAPGARRRGIGRALLHRALVEIADGGIEQAVLGVVAGNDAAVGLYRSVGFEVVDGITTVRRP